MVYTRKNKGTCSSSTTVELDQNNVIKSISVAGGCDGNLKGICSLLEGQSADAVIERLSGLTCGRKKTSCPDQIALAIAEAVENNK